LHSIWLAIAFSALSAAGFAVAIALGFSLADIRDRNPREARETWAAVAASIGVLMLLVAAVFWIGWVIFGPTHHVATELQERSE
jgi:flagellar biosynthesis protein FliR